jgi:hypothetical protein
MVSGPIGRTSADMTGYYDGATELYEYGWGKLQYTLLSCRVPWLTTQPSLFTSVDSSRERLSYKE